VSKNVAVFVDVANIFYAAKAAGRISTTSRF